MTTAEGGASAPAGRACVDWAAVEAEYRTGTYSTRQLAARHGCTEAGIRWRAKAHEWQRDLSADVARATADKLLRADLRTANAREDAQVVAEVAETRAGVVLAHRRDIARHTARVAALAAKLDALLPTADKLSDIMDAQGVIESMARTYARLIPLERQAFGLTDKGAADDVDGRAPDQIKAALDRKLSVLGLGA